jgi:hypothetical protein
LGAKIVGVNRAASSRSPVADIEVTTDHAMVGAALIGPGVDVGVINPTGFVRETGKRVVAVATRLVSSEQVQSISEDLGVAGPVEVIDAARMMGRRGPDSRTDPADFMNSLRSARLLLDHPLLHDSDFDRARTLAWLACAGMPIVSHRVDDDVRTLLGPGMAEILTRATSVDMDDPDARERHSVALRRASLRELSVQERIRTAGALIGGKIALHPAVSVVMATKRPDYLEHALGQIAAQTYPNIQVIVALHGKNFPADAQDRLQRFVGLNVEVVTVPGSGNLGDALNAAVDRAEGDVVSKWDDDDWYGAEHLWDVVLAREYSGAEAVGKAAEFVYLADLQITIRRFEHGAESPSRTLAGGTLTVVREVLRECGGYPSLPRYVDQELLGVIRNLGAASFRTHGYGYVLNRHGAHTWDIETDYFLNAAFRQWRGLRLEEAGCDERDVLTVVG